MLSVSVTKRLGLNGNTRPVSHSESQFELDVEFVVPAGVTILFGASGAGKTTALRCIAGIARPDSGIITARDRVLFDSAKGVNLPIRERRAGYVFQNLALFPHLTSVANVEFGILASDAKVRRQTAMSFLGSLGVEHTANRRPAEVSGGEAQRVALARALAARPDFLLLDEPLSAVDEATKIGIIRDLKRINRDLKLPVIYVTHSRDEASMLGERILVVERGRITAAGEPLEVFDAPVSKSVARLTGVENIFEAVVISNDGPAGASTVRLTGKAGEVCIAVPLSHRQVGERLTVAIRSGDILLALEALRGTSARNMLTGPIESIETVDNRVLVRVTNGVSWLVSLTKESARELDLSAGKPVWIAFKTYSCHLLDK